MAGPGFLKRHGIVRNAIRDDMLYFALPAILALFAGLSVSAWTLVRHQGILFAHLKQNYVGLVMYFTGLTIMIVAQITLWKSYSATLVIREDHKLITHGIYRFVRNPIYLGGIFALMGIPVYCSSPYGLLTMSALIPIILNRIRMEEKLLTEEFGDKHRAYKESVSKLIPFIY
ncbi:methyltransferase family protein [Candidatus Latescibacterota bacterium]